MYKLSTAQWRLATVLLSTFVAGRAAGQAVPPPAPAPAPAVDWRHIGNFTVELGLAGPASGPVQRVWFGTGGTLLAQIAPDRIYQTYDLENWQRSTASVPPPVANAKVQSLPESGARARAGDSGRVYALGNFVYRSDDGGAHWENMTAYRGASIVGGGLVDLAVAPGNSDEIVTAGAAGVFRSVDGGRSWSGLNQGLPNLRATRLLNLPAGDQGVRIALLNDAAADWPPGNKEAWLPAGNSDLVNETQLRAALSSLRGVNVTALAIAGDFIYTGMQNGDVSVSANRGLSWQTFSSAGSGAVERFWIDAQDPRVALAALGAAPDDSFRTNAPAHVLHTVNGGAFWDNFTANLPDGAAHGVAADRASGVLYAATDSGVVFGFPANPFAPFTVII